MISERESGPPELELFRCGQCGEPVETFWAAGHRGLLDGEYALMGDVIFHQWCCDEYLKEFTAS